MFPAEEEVLYKYLTGDKHTKNFFVVLGENTCHDTHISDPQAIVSILNRPSIFKSTIGDNPEVRSELRIYPNPVSENTKISYVLPANEFVSIQLFDASGKLIKTFISEFVTAGEYQFQLPTADLSSGIYLVVMNTGSTHHTAKLIRNQ